jgi:hypothetical protein
MDSLIATVYGAIYSILYLRASSEAFKHQCLWVYPKVFVAEAEMLVVGALRFFPAREELDLIHREHHVTVIKARLKTYAWHVAPPCV